jgi:hypothetical protein
MKLTLTDLIYLDDPKGRQIRMEGGDWPGRAYTMIGLARLDNLQFCMEDTLKRGIPGDFIDAAPGEEVHDLHGEPSSSHGVTDRRVWVADSFEGCPFERREVPG